LTRLSWLRRFFRDSKGISTAIGTVLLVLAMFVISSNVFLFTISQNTLYTQAVTESHQTDADRFNEKIVALNGNHTVAGNQVTVEADLTNAGSVAAQVIKLWVFDTYPTNQRYNYASLDLNLNPGDVFRNVVTVTIPGAQTSHSFVSYFVTARGNTVPVTAAEVNGTIVAQVALGIGKVGMDFDAFLYYNVSGTWPNYNLTVWPNGAEGFNVRKNRDIAFRVTLTNFDSNKRTIQLNSHSVLWMIFPTIATQVRCAWWYIVNVNGSGKILSTAKGSFSDVSLPYGSPAYVYFASSEDLSMNNFGLSSSGYDGPSAVNLMLFGKIGGSTFGQNIPFVSVYVT